MLVSVCEHVQSLQTCLTLCNLMNCSPPGSSVHGNSPGKNIGVDCHAFLQGIFLTQGSNPSLLCLLPLQVDCLPTEPHGKPQYISATLESLMKMSLQKNVKIKTIWRKIQMTEQKGRAATVSFTLSPPLGTHQHVLNCQNVVTVVLLD